jgi:4-amino-4-deoxy-L-arabinose transferase-like glycosyltransferase
MIAHPDQKEPMKLRTGKQFFSSPVAIVLVALAIRMAVLPFVFTNQLDPARDHWAFGFETGKIARSLATGQGFSSPYVEPTGPTALMGPVYPALLAVVFKLFGIYSAASGLVILTLNNLFSSLTCLPVFLIARRVFGERAGIWSAWAWAFFPFAIGLSNLWVWETVLTTFLFSVLLLFSLRLESSSTYRAWIGYGLLWALAGLTSPATLIMLPFLGLWIVLRQWQRGVNCIGMAALASLVFAMAVTPWLWRDARIYGRFVPFRSNMGMDFLVGNSDDTSSPHNLNTLPSMNENELRHFREIGEPAYMSEKQQQAKEFVASHPGRVIWQSLRRVLFVWTGWWSANPGWSFDDTGFPFILTNTLLSMLAFVGLIRAIQDRIKYALPLAVVAVCYPMLYYVTHPDMRFRHPIDPLIAMFIVYAFASFQKSKEEFVTDEITVSPPRTRVAA